MVQSCAAFNCTARYSKASPLKFFRFPDQEKDRRRWRAWVKATRRKHFVPSKTTVLCEHHFCEEDYIPGQGKVKRLKSSAIPSIFSFSKPREGKKSRTTRNSAATDSSNPEPRKMASNLTIPLAATPKIDQCATTSKVALSSTSPEAATDTDTAAATLASITQTTATSTETATAAVSTSIAQMTAIATETATAAVSTSVPQTTAIATETATAAISMSIAQTTATATETATAAATLTSTTQTTATVTAIFSSSTQTSATATVTLLSTTGTNVTPVETSASTSNTTATTILSTSWSTAVTVPKFEDTLSESGDFLCRTAAAASESTSVLGETTTSITKACD